MVKKNAKVIFNKSGGTASASGVTNRVTIPTLWIKEMGITKEERNVELIFDKEKKEIIIKKPLDYS